MTAKFWATQIKVDDVQNVHQTMLIMNYFFEILTPKGPNVRTVDKLVLVSVT
jgi:hypothetical protein